MNITQPREKKAVANRNDPRSRRMRAASPALHEERRPPGTGKCGPMRPAAINEQSRGTASSVSFVIILFSPRFIGRAPRTYLHVVISTAR